MLKRVVCWFLGHAWPWPELSGPPFKENLTRLLEHDFACRRCGWTWAERMKRYR